MIDPEVDALLQAAIAQHRLIRFRLDGRERIVEPHDYGVLNGVDRLFVYQVRGASRSGRLPDWRLVTLADASDFELLDEKFSGARQAPSGKHLRWDNLLGSVSRSVRREPRSS